jgi:hypothetical protein
MTEPGQDRPAFLRRFRQARANNRAQERFRIVQASFRCTRACARRWRRGLFGGANRLDQFCFDLG